jgi:hypothetical protein
MRFVDGESGPDWATDGHNRVLALTVGLSPVWLLAVAYVTRSPFGGGIDQPSEQAYVGGLPIWMLVFAVAGALMLAGTIAIWRARTSRRVLAAVAFLTLPAFIIALFGPAVVLVLTNLMR